MMQRNYRYYKVNSTKYTAVMDAIWASVVGDEVDGNFLVLEVPPLLRGSVDICSLRGTPNPRIVGFRRTRTQK